MYYSTEVESFYSRLKELKEEAIQFIESKVAFPGNVIEVDIPSPNWYSPDPPSIIKVKMFEDEEVQMEGILSDGTHYSSGEVRVLWDNTEDEDENYISLDFLDSDTLIDLAEYLLTHKI